MPSGRTTIDFGAFPGTTHASVAVAETGIVAGSEIEAWIEPEATADHSEDEHMLEQITVVARDKNVGVGFTVHGLHQNPLFDRSGPEPIGTRIYGLWTFGWASKND
jgi:hypothetical protein